MPLFFFELRKNAVQDLGHPRNSNADVAPQMCQQISVRRADQAIDNLLSVKKALIAIENPPGVRHSPQSNAED